NSQIKAKSGSKNRVLQQVRKQDGRLGKQTLCRLSYSRSGGGHSSGAVARRSTRAARGPQSRAASLLTTATRTLRPSQRSAAGRDVVGIPDLLRQHAAARAEATHRREIGPRVAAGLELVVASLAGEQRPASADPGPIERPAVGMLAIAVAVVSMPDRAVRRL